MNTRAVDPCGLGWGECTGKKERGEAGGAGFVRPPTTERSQTQPPAAIPATPTNARIFQSPTPPCPSPTPPQAFSSSLPGRPCFCAAVVLRPPRKTPCCRPLLRPMSPPRRRPAPSQGSSPWRSTTSPALPCSGRSRGFKSSRSRRGHPSCRVCAPTDISFPPFMHTKATTSWRPLLGRMKMARRPPPPTA